MADAATLPAALLGVGAVVVTHQTPAHAARCVESLRRSGVGEVVVVDAGSADDTPTIVARRAPWAHVLELANLGFGRCANAGVAALPAEVDVVIVCNADTLWQPSSARPLSHRIRSTDAVAAGPSVTYPDGRPQASARALPSVATAIGHAVLGRWRPANRWTSRYHAGTAAGAQPGWLSGCALALDRAAFEQVGGFDPRYFLYMEDVDLGVRLRAAGGSLVVVPEALVVHEVGASTTLHRRRAVLAHARSIDRFATDHVLRGPWRLVRPLLWVALAAWSVSQLGWERVVGSRTGRATTGE